MISIKKNYGNAKESMGKFEFRKEFIARTLDD